MSKLEDEYAVNTTNIQQGVQILKRRQTHLMGWCIFTTSLALVALISYFLQQEILYSWFGISLEVKQLHIPVSADRTLMQFGQAPNYFFNLLSWFGWLFLKITSAFIGAFFVIHFLKKLRFFAIRFQSFVLKFVGWIIAFICIWSTLTYVQYDWNDEAEDPYATAIEYKNSLHESELAQYLDHTQLAPPVKAYVLAQIALLHSPADENAAIPYVLTLVDAEKNDPNFIQYGFSASQLWSMQQQLYGKAITPLAKSISPKIEQAQKWENILQVIIISSFIVSSILSLMLYLLSRYFSARTRRIEQNLKNTG
ncbi:hypothetical protein DCO44_10495 [Acinetobacter sp. AM]|uniref:hypothetical protein n=1 Tax=Acinetobacter sp. AM TaxID=2170730 RepID=UPI000DE5DA8E|nr:hypothetical protein [Acinetobacter sp. AM]PWB14145.1 hypothetical protein DCO44_10495 [Acinetobacter sp. AM]